MARGMTPKDIEIAQRRAEVAALYLSRKTQVEIAAELGVDQATISRDLTALQALWRSEATEDVGEVKARELARIDRLEREYWQAWEDSKGKRTTTSKKMSEMAGNKRAEASTREEDLLGDPRYLAGVQWCITRRCEILGIDAPKKTEIGGIDGKDIVIKYVNQYTADD